MGGLWAPAARFVAMLFDTTALDNSTTFTGTLEYGIRGHTIRGHWFFSGSFNTEGEFDNEPEEGTFEAVFDG